MMLHFVWMVERCRGVTRVKLGYLAYVFRGGGGGASKKEGRGVGLAAKCLFFYL